MTDTIDTGEIARHIPPDVTARIYHPVAFNVGVWPPRVHYAEVRLRPDETLVLDNRTGKPYPGRAVMELGHRPDSLDDLMGLDQGGYPPVPKPVPPQPSKLSAQAQPDPMPVPPPPRPQKWPDPVMARTRRPFLRQGLRRMTAVRPAWARWALAFGALLAVSGALTVAAIVAWFR